MMGCQVGSGDPLDSSGATSELLWSLVESKSPSSQAVGGACACGGVGEGQQSQEGEGWWRRTGGRSRPAPTIQHF